MLDILILNFFEAMNEVLTSGIVILAASMLLYNLTGNLRNRVARSSGLVLASVTIAYVIDVLLSLDPTAGTKTVLLRLQWLGIAFIPATMFHLSDALLATTGLPSRGRRRRVVGLLYLIGSAFLLAATMTDLVVIPIVSDIVQHMQAGPMFWLYGLFFLGSSVATFVNLHRARGRCLTAGTQRRMAYLQAAILTPALGIFPYSIFLTNPNEPIPLTVVVIINIANLVVIGMLLFLSYPLSFFGSSKPDRVVKVELLRFLLRGPGTGLWALGVIIFTSRSTAILGIDATAFVPFAVVAVVLFWQWSIDIALPYLEKFLVYGGEDDQQITKLQDLSDRLLTQNDLLQLIEANLEACCDYLRAPSAFVVSIQGNRLELLSSIGALPFDRDTFEGVASELSGLVDEADEGHFIQWQSYQVTMLYTARATDDERIINGMMGIETHEDALFEDEDSSMIERFVARTQRVLDDIFLQNEIFASLEGLLPQITSIRGRIDDVEYQPARIVGKPSTLLDKGDVYEQVRAALRHYWGGPGITRSRLLSLDIVKSRVNDETTPAQALRQVLQQAIEKQRPEGQRGLTSPEWTIYNILELRFIERKKVADVARRMALSQSDLFRKQRVAIDAITETILKMESEHHAS